MNTIFRKQITIFFLLLFHEYQTKNFYSLNENKEKYIFKLKNNFNVFILINLGYYVVLCVIAIF